MDTHLEPDILECEVKWALGSITTNKASGGDGIPVELFQLHEPLKTKFSFIVLCVPSCESEGVSCSIMSDSLRTQALSMFLQTLSLSDLISSIYPTV